MVACSEMAIASNIGVVFGKLDNHMPLHAKVFGEEQGRYLVTSKDQEKLSLAANNVGVPLEVIGITGGDTIEIAGESISLSELQKIHESWLPNFMN